MLGLSHFRSHPATRLMFDGRPVALFGPNGAGKTNILEAASLLSPGRGLRRATVQEIARRPEALGWKVMAELDRDSVRHDLETWAEGEAARQVRIDGKPAPQVALGRLMRIVWLVPAMDRLWIEGAEGRRRFLDRLALAFLPDHAEPSLIYDKAMRERNRLLRDGISDAGWLSALEARMAEAGARIEANRGLTVARLVAAQEGAETAFPAAELRLVSPEPFGAGSEGLAAALAEGRRRDAAAGRTLTGPHRTDLEAVYATRATPAAQCSTGEQKALLLSLVLASARALSEDFGEVPLLLLDEVAAHLDADRRAALYDEIVALGAQAMMTGTGADSFEALRDRAQRFEVTEQGGVSVLREVGG